MKTNDQIAGYVFISPWLFGFFAFIIIPMGASLYLSLTRYDMLSAPVWVGLTNYVQMFTNDPRFLSAIRVTFVFVAVAIPLKLTFALLLALLFKQRRMFVGLYRTLFYIPSLIGGSVAVAVMWKQLFGLQGALNSVLRGIGLLREPIGWLGDPRTALGPLILLSIWDFGSPMLIFLAGLKQIPGQLYDSARIDGARATRQFFAITIPILSPIIFFNFIMQLIGGFMTFTAAYIITEGGPMDTTLFYALYMYQKAFQFSDMGYACALAWILLAINAVFAAAIFKSSRFWVFYEAKLIR